MGYSYVLLHGAQVEYAEIVRYLVEALESPQAASNFADEFDRQIEIACENPFVYGLSHILALADLGYRKMLVNHYVALYKVEGDLVVVAHVFHQSQDYARLV